MTLHKAKSQKPQTFWHENCSNLGEANPEAGAQEPKLHLHCLAQVAP